MRIMQRLLLFAGMALAAITLTAGTASAQETEVEVIDEHTGAPCSPCDIHITGESHIRDGASGVIILTCSDEFEGVINHDGSGWVTWDGDQHGAPGCNVVNCQGGTGNGTDPHEEHEWPLSRAGELGGETEHIWIRICYRNPMTGGELHCDGEITVEDPLHNHEYELHTGANGIACLGGARVVEGMWNLEHDLHDEIEIHHHNDEAA